MIVTKPVESWLDTTQEARSFVTAVRQELTASSAIPLRIWGSRSNPSGPTGPDPVSPSATMGPAKSAETELLTVPQRVHIEISTCLIWVLTKFMPSLGGTALGICALVLRA
jgi:hypothetical protein